MLVFREIMHCRPGKVRDMVNSFKGLGMVMERLGYRPFRLMTDVSGERFWTVILETELETVEDFLEMERRVMGEEDARKAMSGYHDLVESGRREIYRLEG